MTCDELLRALGDYVDGDLSRELRAALEEHLAGCSPCHVVIDSIRRTITLYRGERAYTLPPELKCAIEARLRARWTELHPPEKSAS